MLRFFTIGSHWLTVQSDSATVSLHWTTTYRSIATLLRICTHVAALGSIARNEGGRLMSPGLLYVGTTR